MPQGGGIDGGRRAGPPPELPAGGVSARGKHPVRGTCSEKSKEVCRALEVPVGVKEVGFGIHGGVARKLFDAGVQVCGCGRRRRNLLGSGGEIPNAKDPLRAKAAEAFADWGFPPPIVCGMCADRCRRLCLIASGGLETGVDAAKSIAFGADLAGFGRSLLPAAATCGSGGDRPADGADRIGVQDRHVRRRDRRVDRLKGKSGCCSWESHPFPIFDGHFPGNIGGCAVY